LEGRKKETRKERPLWEVTIKIGLERIDTQEGVTIETLLDSGVTGLVMSLEFAKKQGFKLKRLERPINIRNVDGSLNKEGLIENMVEVNIYYVMGHFEHKQFHFIFFSFSDFIFIFIFLLFYFERR